MSKEPTIPAYVRSMLEPYREVTNQRRRKPLSGIEMALLPVHDRPNNAALESIGRVATAWAVLEYCLQALIARLALAAPYPAGALIADLSIDNRLRALKTLVVLHHERYRHQVVHDGILKVVSGLIPLISPLKDLRNKIVHTVWIQAGADKLSRLRIRTVPLAALRAEKKTELSIAEIQAAAAEIQRVANGLHLAAQVIPDVDETWLTKSLAQAERRRHRGNRSKREAPPQSSGE